ncbi:Dual specificity phosphatase 12 [Chlorella sorokiniana]|uniref:protein-tyrosine-phosphatase n=1 Tax=Chlorella sorokiniana TaxID=3076 RepID=A0A2P6TG54_CHLSO|nr:Dual specificity phosphatase 12 [Chlorella sorokiniana]|eukprot:PRW33102.1 Dual specificity phosphatase 12 [Chlorella sorokiniana]
MPHHSHPGGVVEVAPGLFIGGIASLDHLQQLHITHVVSVVNEPATVTHAQLEGRQRHLVDVADTEETNLLQHLPAAVAFVAAALSSSGSGSGSSSGGNRVLIHCAQGVSRSAAVAVAYLMARSPGLEPEAALAALRQKYPAASPNAGFMRQLELFFAMGCRLADGYLPYKRFLLEQAAAQYSATGLPALDAAALSQPQEAAAGDDGATLYRCRKCRALVATQHNVVETEQGPGASAFSWRKRDKQQRASLGSDGMGANSSSTGPEEGSLFVEPLRWMCDGGGGPGGDSVVGGAMQGKLYCPKCQVRLGSFNWAGTQSSSGAWVTPAFQLHLSKLDAVDPRPPVALAGIRQPRMLGGVGSSAAPAATAAVDGLAAQLQAAGVSDPQAAVSGAAAQQGAAAPPADGVASGSGGDGSSSSGNGSPFHYLILDCDGVLVDSERASCEALRQAILQVTGFDIPHDFPVDFQPVFGMDVWHCIEYYQQRFGRQDWGDTTAVAQQVSDAKEPIYQRLTAAGIAAFPGVAALVAQARQLGMGVAVASSGSPDKIAHNLGSSGLAHLFPDAHLIVSAKYVQRGKPAPDVYLETLRRLGCTDASQALVVEDAVNGLKAAKAAGCFAVAVCTSLPGHMLAAHADTVVERLVDLDLAAVQRAAPQPPAGA